MSASPSGQSNGPTPNGGPPQYIRRPRAADPLRPRKKPIKRPRPNPLQNRTTQKPVASPLYPVNGLAPQRGVIPLNVQAEPQEANGGWTHKPEGEFRDFPLVTTKKALREGLRYHVARFAGKKEIDPQNQNDFTRPVALHRRDPQQPSGKGVKEDEMEIDGAMDSKEREKQEIAKAEREKQRAIDLAQIAPTGNNASALAVKKVTPFRNEKTTQVHRLDKTEEEKKASDLRYEEALPWHLEDADSKNTWVGNYEAALSDTNVAFVIQDGVFKMIPLEKWYKFTSKGQFKVYTIDEAEAKMGKKVKESRWVMKTNEQREADRANQEGRRAMAMSKLYTVKAESITFKNSGKREVADMDELDFDGDDLFQDDDELATVEPDKDEESKEAQERIKKEQLGANVFDQANEAEVDQELIQEEKEAEDRKKLGKGVKKALKKRERNYIYDSDSDHPYSDTSEDDTSDEEKQKEIDRKKDEDAKNKAKIDPKFASGASSKGSNTPSGRPKHTDPTKNPTSLKRPGSPNLSESSGNESSRKKPKKYYSDPPGTSTPVPGSRQISPVPQATGQTSRKSSIVKLNVNPSKLSDIQSAPPNPSSPGALIDGEANAGEMSDTGRQKHKLKIRVASGASPVSSRQGSPAPGRIGPVASGSHAASPVLQTQAQPLSTPKTGPITTSDIIAALPSAGISIGNLMKSFGGRVGDDPVTQTKKQDFIRLVRENAKFGSDKLLRPK